MYTHNLSHVMGKNPPWLYKTILDQGLTGWKQMK